MALYHIDNLSFAYPMDSNEALKGIQLEIEPGEFVLIIGESGCGKTTLLRHFKKELMPGGNRKGSIKYRNKNIEELSDIEAVKEIGMVFQDVESQIVMDSVIAELSFAMENIGLERDLIMRRIAEITSYFGIDDILNQQIADLSGGQKQMVNICSVLALEPKVMLLDEPTSQLDPMARKELINMISQLNRELDITIIMSTHSLDEVCHIADRVIYMEGGGIKYHGNPNDFIRTVLLQENKTVLKYIPEPSQLMYQLEKNIDDMKMAYSVKEVRRKIGSLYFSDNTDDYSDVNEKEKLEELFSVKNVSFAYDIYDKLVLESIDLKIYRKDIIAILGPNGSGKTTLLKVLGGIIKPQKGKVKFEGKKHNARSLTKHYSPIGYVSQNPLLHFTRDSVKEELDNVCKGYYVKNKLVYDLVRQFGLVEVLEHHPYDLSGGQQQKLAIIMALAKEPMVLLLDEPTKGLDPISKEELAKLLVTMNNSGISIVVVSHDLNFVARYMKRVVMLFNKDIVYDGDTRRFLRDNNYYTTKINQIMKMINENCITIEDINL